LSMPRQDAATPKGTLKSSSLKLILAAIVKRFDVRASATDPEAWRLSGGNLQKYVLGREIVRRPSLLVVNQPTWGVDAAATQHIRQALLDLAGEGAAVLVISQDLDEVFALADTIAVIRNGQLTKAVPAGSLSREDVGLMMTTATLESSVAGALHHAD
jgi:general nucleoside transport system ATP-binding protein